MKVKKGRSKKTNKRKFWLQKLIRINVAVILILSVFYMSAGFSLDSGFFVRDAQEKYAVAAETETALKVRVIGVPDKPIVTANASCYRGVPLVDLSWTATGDTNYYAIERDSNALISGLTTTNYRDGAVSENTTYEYEVTAVGPVGSTVSDPVSITTPADCPALPAPTISIVTIDNVPISQYFGTPTITNRTPVFAGNTNIPNAIIQIEIIGAVPMMAQIQANVNGYWSWQVPMNLGFGLQTIKATTIDPLDISREESTTLQFNVKNTESGKNEQEKEKSKKETTEQGANEITPSSEIIIPFKLLINVENQNKEVQAGQELLSRVHIQKIKDFSSQEIILHYQIYNSNNQVVLETDDQVFIDGDTIIHKKIKIPGLLSKGNYKIFVSTSFEGVVINAADSFRVVEKELLNLGGRTAISMTVIMKNVSWILLWLLLLLIIFLVLLYREYRLSEKAKIQITEKMLYKQDFF